MASSGFCDLNILVKRENKNHMAVLKDTLKAAYRMGYDTVAVNTFIEENAETVEEKKRGKDSQIPPPVEIDVDDITGNEGNGRKFTVLQRLTVVISDAIEAHKLTSSSSKMYNILAAQPTTARALHVCCSTLDVDIICFPISSRLPAYPRHKQINLAVERGLFFEVTYVPGMGNSMSRRYNIQNAITIINTCKKKNILVSSEASQPLHIRSPYDVINLCKLFGLKSPEASAAISSCGRRMLMKMLCRKSGKGMFTLQVLDGLPKVGAWKVGQCKNTKIQLDVNKDNQRPPKKLRKNDETA